MRVRVCVCLCVGPGGKKGEGMVSQMSKKHQESQVFVLVHPLAQAFGENSVKLLSQVYWSPGLLEREVIYPSVIGKILAAVSAATLSVHMQHQSGAITPNMTMLLQFDADGVAASSGWTFLNEAFG